VFWRKWQKRHGKKGPFYSAFPQKYPDSQEGRVFGGKEGGGKNGLKMSGIKGWRGKRWREGSVSKVLPL